MQTPKVLPVLPLVGADLYGSIISNFTNKLYERKTPLQASELVTYIDDNGRQVEVYYRLVDACPNAQTDIAQDCYHIEAVLYKGRHVRLTSSGEQTLYEWLYETNPAKSLPF